MSASPDHERGDAHCVRLAIRATKWGQTVKGRHEITVKLPVAVCRDEIRAKLAEAIAEIRGDYRSTIALEPLVH
jgi:hypothetical protein